MMGLAGLPEMVRNVAIVGHLHHGKTSLVDMLVYETHQIDFDCDKPVRSFCSGLVLANTIRLASIHRHSLPLSITTRLYQIYSNVARFTKYSRKELSY